MGSASSDTTTGASFVFVTVIVKDGAETFSPPASVTLTVTEYSPNADDDGFPDTTPVSSSIETPSGKPSAENFNTSAVSASSNAPLKLIVALSDNSKACAIEMSAGV